MKENELFQIWDSAFKNSIKKSRKCMVNDCNKLTINSHTLQKNGILRQMSEKNHLYQFSSVPPFHREEKGNFELKRIGVNNAYTFNGFCAEHDSILFKPIEGNDVNLYRELSINLFSYRALCQEIFRKEVAFEVADTMIETNYNIPLLTYMTLFKRGLSQGLESLKFFKTELENDMNTTSTNFKYQICEIPNIDVCISTPQTLEDDENPLSKAEDENGNAINIPFVTSIINIFPFHGKSYVMVANHDKYTCSWTNKLFLLLSKSKDLEHLKIISDLICLRTEFWCISPKLFRNIKPSKITQLKEIWSEEMFNFDSNLKSDFNLFDS